MYPEGKESPLDEPEGRLPDALRAICPGVLAAALIPPEGCEGGCSRVLAVVEDFREAFQRRMAKIGEGEFELLIVDRGLFESDLLDSALLEAVAWRLLLPYRAVMGGEYLDGLVRRYRYRKLRESLTGLVLEHPVLSTELLIDPRYFLADILLKVSHEDLQSSGLLKRIEDEGVGSIAGYEEAIGDLERDGMIIRVDGHFKVDPGFAASVRRRLPLQDYIERANRLMRRALRHGPSWARGLFQLLAQSPLESRILSALGMVEAQRADRYVYYPTSRGLTPLSRALDLPSMLSSLEGSDVEDLRVQRYGGVLNEVYLLTYRVDDGDRRVIMKRYTSWTSLKWAPVVLWTIGTRNFSVLGRARMERECAASSLLRRMGIPVPEILQASFEDQLIIREYIEGENLAEAVRRVVKGLGKGRELELIRRAGGLVAAVHGAGAILGDCKPENFLVSDGEPTIVDLEQGGRGEEGAWDIAEFIYFSGHYADPLDQASNVVRVSESFIDGYLEGGGDASFVEEASGLKYAKLFAPLVLPHILMATSRACRSKAGKGRPPHVPHSINTL
jgi:tRNA A-37 threonylcarbamoyl transferase component Bud32